MGLSRSLHDAVGNHMSSEPIDTRKTYEGIEFAGLLDFDSAATCEEMRFDKCIFKHCILSSTRNPRTRTRVRDVVLSGCEVRACFIGPAIITNALVENLRTFGGLQTEGAVFHRVTFVGKIDAILLGPLYPTTGESKEAVQAINDASEEFYQGVDWAIDISRAQFSDCDLRGIPGQLVRRDPETQVVVQKRNLVGRPWDSLDLAGTHWATALEWQLADGPEAKVLVAPKRAKNFRELLTGLELLRKAGIADPD